MANPGLKLNIETIRSLLFSSISTTYFKIVNVATENPSRLICFTNLTNSNLFITITSGNTPASDGTEDQIILPANGYKILDIMTNHYPQEGAPMELPKGSYFWARTATGSSDPTSGFVYVEVYYGA